MIHSVVGKKIDQSQAFLTDGRRIPVTLIEVSDIPVVMVKTFQKHGYNAVQLGFGIKKNPSKALLGHMKGAKLEKAPLFLHEVRIENEVSEDSLPKMGDMLSLSDALKIGDVVDATAVSKGKGFAGGVKRHHFKGGPRTHGQSDRERAPGSIGQTTTPGRVYKGKRMAGKMGNSTATVKNLMVVDISSDRLLVKGLVPGAKNRMVIIKKVGEVKKFVPLYKEPTNSSDDVKEEK